MNVTMQTALAAFFAAPAAKMPRERLPLTNPTHYIHFNVYNGGAAASRLVTAAKMQCKNAVRKF